MQLANSEIKLLVGFVSLGLNSGSFRCASTWVERERARSIARANRLEVPRAITEEAFVRMAGAPMKVSRANGLSPQSGISVRSGSGGKRRGRTTDSAQRFPSRPEAFHCI
jgi:hypothetical protein